MNPYEILGIDRTATVDDARKAYRRLAKKYHPDVQRQKGQKAMEEAEQKMREVNEAWEVLKDGNWQAVLVCRHRTLFTFTETEG